MALSRMVWRDTKIVGFPNDLKPHNYGAGYRAFDPAIDLVTIAVATGGAGVVGGGTIYVLHSLGLIWQ